MQLFESPDLTLLDYCLWGCMKSEVNARNLDTADELLAHILDAAGSQINVKINSDEQHAVFSHGLQSELWLTVGFWENLL